MSHPRKRNNITTFKPLSESESFEDPFKPRKRSQMSSLFDLVRPNKLLWISVIWLFFIYYLQRVRPSYELRSCQWPDIDADAAKHNVLLIADPQLVDDHTYPDRPRLIQWFTKTISDNYMAINYKLMQEKLEPDTTIFLGDLFDGGREWHDDEKWYDEWKRFNRIFPAYPNRKTFYNILGNHDAGWDKTINKTIHSRFRTVFGEPNDYQKLGNHTFLFLDTIALSALNNNDSSIAAEARYYLNNLTYDILPALDQELIDKNQRLRPRVLLSHVPFFRDPRVEKCRGPREHTAPFPLVNGGTFQTVLFPELTNELLETLQPEIIFSGDDHDYCEINHNYSPRQPRGSHLGNMNTREITVKSFSMNMGVKYPAAQLLSLSYPLDKLDYHRKLAPSYETSICFPYSPFPTLNTYLLLLLFLTTYWALYSLFAKQFVFIELFVKGEIKSALNSLTLFLPIAKLIIPYSFRNRELNSSRGVLLESSHDRIWISLEGKLSPDVLKDIRRAVLEAEFKARNYKEFALNLGLQITIVFALFSYFYIIL